MTISAAAATNGQPVWASARHDSSGNLLPLQSYGATIQRGMKFLLEDQDTWAKGNTIKDEEGKIRPPYFFYCVAFDGNGQLEQGVAASYIGTSYPSMQHAMFINSFLSYYIYSGNEEALRQAEELAAWNISHSTPVEWKYGGLPYSTARKGRVGTLPDIADRTALSGYADGDAIMTDKSAMMASAYLRLYQTTRKAEYLKAAERIADTLVKTQLPAGNWAFRVEPKTGAVRELYTSSTIYEVVLFEELDGITGQKRFADAKDKALHWILDGPAQDMNWNGFYQDVGANKNNRTNWDCIDTACYLLRHRGDNKDYLPTAQRLYDWVKKTFVDEKNHRYSPAPAVREQLACNYRMSGHSAHWLALLGCLYDATGEEQYRVALLNDASFITYHLQSDNRLALGPEWLEGTEMFYYWYSNQNCCGFLLDNVLSRCPETAPDKENHLLRYSAAVRAVAYKPHRIAYTTDAGSSEVLKVAFVPSKITLNGQTISAGKGPAVGWDFDAKTNILRLTHPAGDVVVSD